MKNALDWIYGYFLEKDRFIVKDYKARLNIDIFDTGMIDSFEIIELITQIERTFNIELKAKDMQDDNFRTIKGMGQIIDRKLKAGT